MLKLFLLNWLFSSGLRLWNSFPPPLCCALSLVLLSTGDLPFKITYPPQTSVLQTDFLNLALDTCTVEDAN